MKNYIKSAILAAGLVFGAGQGFAATLGLTTGVPSLSSSMATIDYLDLNPDGELSAVSAEVDSTGGVTTNGFTTIDFVAGFALADPTDVLDFSFGGFLDVSDEDGQFLVGDLFGIGFTENAIELQFNNLTGSGAGNFGSSVLALISFTIPLGLNPFTALNDGDFLDAEISVSNVAPVPLPAGLPLILSALFGLGVVARRKSKT
jgi:hypothetical protein